MRNKRPLTFILLLLTTFLTLVSGGMMFYYLITEYKDPMDSLFFIISLSTYGGLALITIIISSIKLPFVLKEHDAQNEIYNDKHILKTRKREKSALINCIVLAILFVPFFIMLNVYYKSGLSKSKRKEATKIFKAININKIIDQKDVQKQIENNDNVKRQINNIELLRKQKADTKVNLNTYLLKVLNESNIEFDFPLDEKKIYYIGKSI